MKKPCQYCKQPILAELDGAIYTTAVRRWTMRDVDLLLEAHTRLDELDARGADDLEYGKVIAAMIVEHPRLRDLLIEGKRQLRAECKQ